MARTPLVIIPIVLVVVQRDDRFLLVQEAKKSARGTWFLPAGSIEPGESPAQAAIRETKEEAGIDVIPRALLWLDDLTYVNDDGNWLGRWRFILTADSADPQQQPGPTKDCLDAKWFTLKEAAALTLRSLEVIDILGRISRGAPSIPLESVYRQLSSF